MRTLLKSNGIARFFVAKAICLLLVMLCITTFSKGQISPLYSKYLNYEQFINPAITGRDISPVIILSRKQYWLDAKNSPNSTCLGASMRLGTFDFYNPHKLLNRSQFLSKGRMGFGGMMMQENDGPMSSYFATLSYAYFVPLNNSGSELSFGLSAQFLYYSINRSMLDPLDPSDPELIKLNSKSITPESGCGLYYHDSQFYLGTSINDLLLSKNPYADNLTPNKRDYFFQTGYKFFLKYFELEPSVYMAKIDSKPLFYFNQVKLYYMDYNWFGLGYKSTKSLLVSLGINIRRMYFAYAYEHNLATMGNYYSGSHEIMFGMNIGLYEPQGMRKRAGKIL